MSVSSGEEQCGWLTDTEKFCGLTCMQVRCGLRMWRLTYVYKKDYSVSGCE